MRSSLLGESIPGLELVFRKGLFNSLCNKAYFQWTRQWEELLYTGVIQWYPRQVAGVGVGLFLWEVLETSATINLLFSLRFFPWGLDAAVSTVATSFRFSIPRAWFLKDLEVFLVVFKRFFFYFNNLCKWSLCHSGEIIGMLSDCLKPCYSQIHMVSCCVCSCSSAPRSFWSHPMVMLAFWLRVCYQARSLTLTSRTLLFVLPNFCTLCFLFFNYVTVYYWDVHVERLTPTHTLLCHTSTKPLPFTL